MTIDALGELIEGLPSLGEAQPSSRVMEQLNPNSVSNLVVFLLKAGVDKPALQAALLKDCASTTKAKRDNSLVPSALLLTNQKT